MILVGYSVFFCLLRGGKVRLFEVRGVGDLRNDFGELCGLKVLGFREGKVGRLVFFLRASFSQSAGQEHPSCRGRTREQTPRRLLGCTPRSKDVLRFQGLCLAVQREVKGTRGTSRNTPLISSSLENLWLKVTIFTLTTSDSLNCKQHGSLLFSWYSKRLYMVV